MKQSAHIFLTIILVTLTVLPAFADFEKFDEGFVDMVLSSDNNDQVRAVVLMSERHDLEELELLVKGLTRQQRKSVVWQHIKETADISQAPLLDWLEEKQAEGLVGEYRSLIIANGISLTTTPELLIEISDRDDVWQLLDDSIRPGLIEPIRGAGGELDEIAWGVEQINAPDVWEDGFTGSGVLVAILDTGVNYEHEDLADHVWDGGEEYPNHGYDFSNNDNDPMDGHAHGTHVAGTVAGDGTAGNQTGVAPEATIMAVKVLQDNGGGTPAMVWAGLDFCFEQEVDVTNLSLGFIGSSNNQKRSWREHFDILNISGIVSCVATGNEGQTRQVPDCVRTPGNVPSPWRHQDEIEDGGRGGVISVGATSSNNNIANFSSFGPVTWEAVPGYNDYEYGNGHVGMYCPDVSAPGVNVLSLDYSDNSGYLEDGWSGTSMATPHVAGTVALMFSKSPIITPAEIDSILQETALDRGENGKDNLYGSGIIRADLAVDAVESNIGILEGEVFSANDPEGERFPNVEIRIEGTPIHALTDENGYFSMMAPSGTQTVLVDYPPYAPFSMDVDIVVDNTLTADIALGIGEFSSDTDRLIVALIDDPEAEANLTISNSGSAAMEVEFKPVPDDLQHEFLAVHDDYDASLLTGDTHLYGVAHTNAHFYVSGANNGDNPKMIYVFNNRGVRVDTADFEQPTEGNHQGMFDLAHDGEYLWGSYGRDIVAMDPVTGEEVDRFAGPYANNRAITYDPELDVLWVADLAHDIVAVSRETGQVIDEINSTELAMGLAFMPNAPDGYSLYMSVMEGVSSRRALYKANPTTGDLVKVGDLPYTSTEALIGGLTLIPNRDQYFTTVHSVINLGQSIEFTDRLVGWELNVEVPWISVTPSSLTLERGEQRDITLLFNGRGLVDGDYTMFLLATHNTIEKTDFITLSITVQGVSVEDNVADHSIPTVYALESPYPNPFNPSTQIRYALPEASRVSLVVFDVLGREVVQLLDNSTHSAGVHELTFDGSGLASGLYFVTMQTDNGFVQSRKLMLLK
ncbi:S8 family serine peptidase [bacterium]|nr:S8 family serine peptidase [bacterium]